MTAEAQRRTERDEASARASGGARKRTESSTIVYSREARKIGSRSYKLAGTTGRQVVYLSRRAEGEGHFFVYCAYLEQFQGRDPTPPPRARNRPLASGSQSIYGELLATTQGIIT